MRVALLNEGAYPYQSGGVSTWCQQLVTGLDRHTFHLVTLTGVVERRPVAYPLPVNVATVNPVAVWDRAIRYVERHGLDLSPIVSTMLPFSRIEEALARAGDPGLETKVLLHPDTPR